MMKQDKKVQELNKCSIQLNKGIWQTNYQINNEINRRYRKIDKTYSYWGPVFGTATAMKHYNNKLGNKG